MEFQKLQSRQGIPVYVLEMPFIKSVALGVLVKAGSRDENWPKEAGIAHAVEHLVFCGTEAFPDSYRLTSFIEKTGGHLNAWTSEEGTFYHIHLPADKVERAMAVLSQMLRRPLFKEEKIKTEMQNIVQEIKMRNDKPQSLAWDTFQKTLYGSHPLSQNPAGLEESVLSFRQTDFLSFIQKFYHPANFTVIAVGNVKAEEIKNLAEKYFPEIFDRQTNSRPKIESCQSESKLLIVQKKIEQANLVFGAATCSADSLDNLPLDLFTEMISGGSSSPLWQEIREKRGLAYAVRAEYGIQSDLSMFAIYIGTDKKRVDEATEVSLEVIKNCKNDEALLEITKEMITGKLSLSYESTRSILERTADTLISQGKIFSIEELIRNIKNVSIEQVKEAVEKYLNPEQLVKVILMPENS